MKILFTKLSIQREVSENLGTDFLCEFKDFIRIERAKVSPFFLKNYSLIFTSANAVKAFFENGFTPSENGLEYKCFNKIYVVGLKTKRQLRKHGFGTFKLMKNASELADFIVEHSVKERFLHFCGNLALDVLDRKLPLQNIFYKKIEVYKTELLFPKLPEKYDAVVFFSPSGVRSFAKNNSFEEVKIFSIGETTEKELKNFTNNTIYTSKENNLEDLLKIIKTTL